MVTDPLTLGPGPLAPPVAEAVHLVATEYAREPGLDVEVRLRQELEQRGAAVTDTSVQALARAVRAGRAEELAADPGDHLGGA
jgi:hypothetical protein